MSNERLLQVLRAPLVSEKSARIQESANQYVFEVARDATKADVKKAVEELFKVKGWDLKSLASGSRTDAQTRDALQRLYAQGYLCEPHGAIAWDLLQSQLAADEAGIFLCTAHPAKFKESVEEILSIELPLPGPLAERAELALLSDEMDADFAALRAYLLKG